MVKIGIVVILSLIAGWLYRRGGTSKGTLWRDLGVSFVATFIILILLWNKIITHFPSSILLLFLSMGLTYGALTAYWGLDEAKFGFWAHALGLSLATLPISYLTGNWPGFALRTLILTVFITIWSEYTKWDVLEEFGRGAGVILSLPLLLI